jgi:polysaccharide biosynthesis/export protein
MRRGLPVLLVATGILGFGQVQQPGGLAQNQPLPAGNGAQAPVAIRPDYVLGPNDQILIRVPQSDEINEKPFRIATDGFIDLPLAGRIKAEGLTVQALEAEVTNRLREYIRQPLVSITVTQFRSEPVFFVGAFRAPGIYPLQGRRTLVEMLTAVGGIQPNASRRIKITRRAEYGPIPSSNAIVDPAKKVSTAEVSLESLTQEVNPAEDIVLLSYDVVSVDRAERIYVSGEVGKVSAIEFGERSSISVAQALTEAGGFTQFAKRDKVRVLRPVLGTNRRAVIDIDVKRVFEGKDLDFPLQPNDVLFVARDGIRSVLEPAGVSFIGSLPYFITTILTVFTLR